MDSSAQASLPTARTSPQQASVPLPHETQAWLGGRWWGVGAKTGKLTFDGSTLVFTHTNGDALFSYSNDEIRMVWFTYGWLRVYPKAGRVQEVALYDPKTALYASLLGRYGAGMIADSEMIGARVDVQWKHVLAPYVEVTGDAQSRFIVAIGYFIGWLSLACAIVIVVSVLLTLLHIYTSNLGTWLLILMSTIATLTIRWFVRRRGRQTSSSSR